MSVEEACAVSVLKEVGVALCGGCEDAYARCACFGQVWTLLESSISWDALVLMFLKVFSVA